ETYAQELGCSTVVVEQRYIDRDYMEDHSVFYSKSLFPYPNFCRRVHFFAADADQLKRELSRLVGVGIAGWSGGVQDGLRAVLGKDLSWLLRRKATPWQS